MTAEADRADFLAMLAEYDLAQYAHALHAGAEAAGGKLDISGLGFPVRVSESPISGKGTFAIRAIPMAQTAYPAVWQGHRTHHGWYTNHSAEPNLKAYMCGMHGDLDYVALRDIEPGEECTIDYRDVVRRSLAASAGVQPHELTKPMIRSALLRLWVQHKCPL